MTAEKPSAAEVRDAFDQFLFEMPEMPGELGKLATQAGRSLDSSIVSLDRAEALLALALDGHLAFVTTIARYVGDTMIKRVGGTWSYVKSSRSPASDIP